LFCLKEIAMNANQRMAASSSSIAWVLCVMAIAVICAVSTAATRTSAELHSAGACASETCPSAA
jgi:hypothetical protein